MPHPRLIASTIRGRILTLFRSLQSRAFALLWGGQTVSRLGDSLYRIALSWWVLEKTGSATAMGLVLVFSFLPMILFLLIGGVAADRLPRIHVMLTSDVLRGVLVGGVALLAVLRLLAVWHIYLASLVFGFVDAFFQPAYVAIVPDVTPAELLPSANALNSLSGQLSGVIGPALGATIVALGGTPTAFALDAVSFFVAGACLLPMLGKAAAPKRKLDAPPPNALRELREGINAVFAEPWLWITIGLFALINVTLFGPQGVALPLLVQKTLNAGVSGFGLLGSLASAGSILGAIWLGRARKLRRRGQLAYASVIVSALAVLAMGLAHPVYRRGGCLFHFWHCAIRLRPHLDECFAGDGAIRVIRPRVQRRSARLVCAAADWFRADRLANGPDWRAAGLHYRGWRECSVSRVGPAPSGDPQFGLT